MAITVYIQNSATSPILACVQGGSTCGNTTRQICTAAGGKTIPNFKRIRFVVNPDNNKICLAIWNNTSTSTKSSTF